MIEKCRHTFVNTVSANCIFTRNDFIYRLPCFILNQMILMPVGDETQFVTTAENKFFGRYAFTKAFTSYF